VRADIGFLCCLARRRDQVGDERGVQHVHAFLLGAPAIGRWFRQIVDRRERISTGRVCDCLFPAAVSICVAAERPFGVDPKLEEFTHALSLPGL
jgi:hypothetical protein